MHHRFQLSLVVWLVSDAYSPIQKSCVVPGLCPLPVCVRAAVVPVAFPCHMSKPRLTAAVPYPSPIDQPPSSLQLSSLQDDAAHVTVPSASIENAAAADASPASKQKEETKEGASAALKVCVSPCVLH